MKFKALIVDDEPLARLALREYISIASNDFEIAGEAGDGKEGIKYAEKPSGCGSSSGGYSDA